MILLARVANTASSLAIVSVIAAAAVFNACHADTRAARQLHYRAHHSVFGDIGTYSNTIEPGNDATTVRTSVHLNVTALGVVLHREDAERTERWKGDRLVYFHGITKTNGEAVEVKGEARGDSFMVTSPLGTITAPGTIFPSNPWSSRFIDSNMIMRTDTGKIEPVRISGGETALTNIAGTSIPTRKYQIDGTIRYKIWIDQQDIPVMFTVDDDSGEVSFSLIR
jgi:hypothetical protein